MGLAFYFKIYIYIGETSHLGNREEKRKRVLWNTRGVLEREIFSREGFFQGFEEEDLKLLVSQFLLLSKGFRISILKPSLSSSCYWKMFFYYFDGVLGIEFILSWDNLYLINFLCCISSSFSLSILSGLFFGPGGFFPFIFLGRVFHINRSLDCVCLLLVITICVLGIGYILLRS